MEKHYNDPIYKVAQSILSRCNNKNAGNYQRYGGKGIKCLLGNNAKEVYQKLLTVKGYKKGLQIDRINSKKHYELGNLRWVTPKENCLNRSSCKSIEFYEIKPTRRDTFKVICKARGWKFDDFKETFTGIKDKRLKKYFLYKKMED